MAKHSFWQSKVFVLAARQGELKLQLSGLEMISETSRFHMGEGKGTKDELLKEMYMKNTMVKYAHDCTHCGVCERGASWDFYLWITDCWN